MLSISFLALRGIPRTPSNEEQEHEEQEEEDVKRSKWSIRVQQGAQREQTRSINLAEMRQELQDAPGEAEYVRHEDAELHPLWEEELEVHDKDGGERVDIAVLFDVQSRTTGQHETFTQSTTTINMSTFRHEPDQRTTLWVPLSPVASPVDGHFGAIKIAVTYHAEDYCVAEGYMFALFCGLVPLSWIDALVPSPPWEECKTGKKIIERNRSLKVRSSENAVSSSDDGDFRAGLSTFQAEVQRRTG